MPDEQALDLALAAEAPNEEIDDEEEAADA